MPVPYIPFGRTGAKVSRLCLGTANFGGRTPEADALRIIARALDAGINYIDTANVYGTGSPSPGAGLGASERVIGQALQGKRDGVFLATKVRWDMGQGPNDRGLSRLHITRQAEESLRRLRTDVIDLYQLHGPDSDTPIEETLGALTDLVRAGKVRYAGTSNFAAWQICEALWVADRRSLVRIVSDQPQYNLLDRHVENELVPFARQHGLALVTYSPTAGGLLSAGYRQGQHPPAGSRKSQGFWMPYADHYEAQVQAVERLLPIADKCGIPLHRLALAWILQRPGVTATILGPRTEAHLDEYLAAAELHLEGGLLKAIDAVVPPGTVA